MALFLVLVEDSSASCLLAGGPSTQLNMVIGGSWWPPSGSSILRPFITSSWVMFMNGLPQLPHAFSQRAGSLDFLAGGTSPPSVGGTYNKLLSEGLVATLCPGR